MFANLSERLSGVFDRLPGRARSAKMMSRRPCARCAGRSMPTLTAGDLKLHQQCRPRQPAKR